MAIYVEPELGICNRLRVIGSAYAAAKRLNEKLCVVWVANRDLQCRSSRLFSLPEDIFVIELNAPDTFSMQFLRMRGKSAQNGILKCGKIIGNDEIIRAYNNRIPIDQVLSSYLSRRENLYVRTCQYLYSRTMRDEKADIDYDYSDFEIFEPSPEIGLKAKTRMDALSENGKCPVIGIHIRRTDHKTSIAGSLSSDFRRIIDAHISKNPNVRFYLATDSEEEYNAFASHYNTPETGYIGGGDKTILNRDSEEGIVEAYTELVCLSQTNCIYGSKNSSFSKVAAILGKTDLHIVNSRDAARLDHLIDAI